MTNNNDVVDFEAISHLLSINNISKYDALKYLAKDNSVVCYDQIREKLYKVASNMLSNKDSNEKDKDGTTTSIVFIEETVCNSFTICHKEDEDPQEIAIEKYKNGKLQPENGNVTSRQIMSRSNDGSETSWREFNV